MNDKKLMIIDGNSIINRAFYGIRLLTNSEGIYTNAVYGFLNILFKFMEEEEPDYLCIAFDMKGPTFRHEIFDEYKANRKGMPDELAMQMPILKEVLQAMNITMIEKEGYEADDIIGALAKEGEKNSLYCTIVTGDRDSLQLASDRTTIKLPVTKKGSTRTEIYDKKAFVEKYGVTPTEFIDVKGLMGDSSDNIPGVPGIGEKTAFTLIQQYKSIENIYDKIETLETRKNIKESLINNKELAILSKQLATIDTKFPLNIDIDTCSLKKTYDKEKLLKIFKRLNFKTYIDKLNLESLDSRPKDSEETHTHITDIDQLIKLKDLIKQNKNMTYKLYVDNIGGINKIISAALTIDGSSLSYIDINPQLSEEKFIEIFKTIFEDNTIKKNGYRIKDDIVTLNQYRVSLNNIGFDCMIAAYILNPTKASYQIEEIAYDYLSINLPSEDSVLGKGKTQICIAEVEKDNAIEFACTQVGSIYKLTAVLENEIKNQQQEHLYYDIELPLIRVLADMQISGFKIDKEKLKSFSAKLDIKINDLSGKIYDLAGEEFNINSPKQLGIILFEKLKLTIIKKTKTGYSTSIEVLEKLKDEHKIIKLIIDYRQVAKLKSTYADGLLNEINPLTGKIHSNFNQTITATGRISSTEPNLQNIPIRLELGREVRKVFTASTDDYLLIDADYSQIELRVLAHISEDPKMIAAFEKNEDIHTKTAAQVFEVDEKDVTPIMRNRAKAVNFGIVYGIGDFSLSQDLDITKQEAKIYIDNYLKNYEKVHEYMKDIVEYAKAKGFVTTLLNRKRYIPELKVKSFFTRSFGERIAMNTPIQGSAADIIKIAMIRVHGELEERQLKSKLILQVHDELIVETHKSEIDIVKEIVKRQMENAVSLKVPLTIDLNMGKNWYDAK